jgi:hypothetical protein
MKLSAQEQAYAERLRALGIIAKANQARQVDNRITFPAVLAYNKAKVRMPARDRPPQA